MASDKNTTHSLVENHVVGYCLFSTHLYLEKVNPATVRLIRARSADELIGRHLSEFVVEEELSRFQEMAERVLGGEVISYGDMRCRNADGSEGRYTFSARPIMRDESLEGVEIIFIDSTRFGRLDEELRQVHEEMDARVRERTAELERANRELQAEIERRKRAEEELATERNLLRTLVDTIPDTIFVKDDEHRFVFCNRACAKNIGAEDPQSMYGLTDFDYYKDKKARYYLQQEERILRNGDQVIGKEDYGYDPFGRERWSLHTKVPWRDSEGRIIGIVGNHRDITAPKKAQIELQQHRDRLEQDVADRTEELTRANERLRHEIQVRKKATDSLRKSERRFREFVEETDNLVVQENSELRYTYVNKAAAKIYGLSQEELIGRSIFDFIPSEEHAGIKEVYRKCVQEKTPNITYENRVHSMAGETRTILWTINLHYTNDQEGPFINAIGRDITDRIRMEEQIRRHNEELEQLVAERSEQLLRVAHLSAVGRLVAGVAHEVNNPLQGILSHLGFIQAGVQDLQALESLEMVRKSVKRIAGVVRQLRELYKSYAYQSVAFDVNNAVDETVKLSRATLKEHSVYLDCQYARNLPRAIGSVSGLHQALVNLIINAQDAMPQGGRLMIATHQKDEHIVITLQDTGIGIDDYLLPQIFEPFITSKLPGEGTGLGLAITRSAIAEMGGDIKVENVPEGGARFTICLKKA